MPLRTWAHGSILKITQKYSEHSPTYQHHKVSRRVLYTSFIWGSRFLKCQPPVARSCSHANSKYSTMYQLLSKRWWLSGSPRGVGRWVGTHTLSRNPQLPDKWHQCAWIRTGVQDANRHVQAINPTSPSNHTIRYSNDVARSTTDFIPLCYTLISQKNDARPSTERWILESNKN